MTLREKLQTSKQTIRPEIRDVSEQVGYHFANDMAKDKFLSFDIKIYAGRIQRIYEDTMHAPETKQWIAARAAEISPDMIFTHVLRDVVHKAQQEYQFTPTDLASLQEYTERFTKQLRTTDSALNCSIMKDIINTPPFPKITLFHLAGNGTVESYPKEEFCAQTTGTERQYDELCRLMSRMRDYFESAPSALATLDDAHETAQFMTEFDVLYSVYFKQAQPEMDATRFAVQCAVRALLDAKNQYADVNCHGYSYVCNAEDCVYKLITQNNITFDGITAAAAGAMSLESLMGCDPREYLEAVNDFEALEVYHKELAMQGVKDSTYTQEDVKWGFVSLTPYEKEAMSGATAFIQKQFVHPDQREDFVKIFRAAVHTYGAASAETAFMNACNQLPQNVSNTPEYTEAIQALREYDKQQAELYKDSGITAPVLATKVLAHLEGDIKMYASEEAWTQFMSAYTAAWESRMPIQTVSEMMQCVAESAPVLDANQRWQDMLSHESHAPWNNTMARIEYVASDIMRSMIHFGGYQITDKTLEYHANYVDDILEAMPFKDRATFMELYAQAVQEDSSRFAAPIFDAYHKWAEAVGYDIDPVYTQALQHAYHDDSDREDYQYEEWD